MAKTLIVCLLFVSGCCSTPKIKTVYKEVRVPVMEPCKAQAPQVFPLPVERLSEATARLMIQKGEYSEFIYKLGSSLVLLNGDVEAYREVLGACQ